MKNIVVAYDTDHAIGGNGERPWVTAMSADIERLDELTLGGTVIMGRGAYEALPNSYEPTFDRQSIILSLGGVAAGEGFITAASLDEAYELAERDEVYVIGGGKVYQQAMPTADRIFATQIHTRVPGVDTYFPLALDGEWSQAERHHFPADEHNRYRHSFITYVRTHALITLG